MTALDPHSATSERRLVERPALPLTGVRRFAGDLGGAYAANGLVGLIFSCTGPVAVILAAGASGALTQAELASWIFGVFFLNGILTIAASWAYRQPLAFFWTIPGTVVVGGALADLSWPEVIGAFIVSGLVILLLGLTGWVRPVMEALPMPIVLAMVAGVFLHFGVELVLAVGVDPAVAVPMVAVFVILSACTPLGRWMPATLGALLVGVAATLLAGRFDPGPASGVFARPVFTAPDWSWQAMVELVVPLVITVLVVQNGQGVAVLRAAGHHPPINAATIACGLWSLAASCVGAVSTCLTGPTNALLTGSGARARQYTAGVVCGVLALVFGVFAPVFVRLMLAMPAAFVATLGGLALLRALQTSFTGAFGGRYTMGALVALLVTVADVKLLGIGAPFWGLAVGIAVSWMLERQDWRQC
ncbi:benzoate/H(+) symporter BenE family transporter [Rhodococcus daqingensis]|uniref:Benzoate/H(+) symporter BenE family transporter n=1 Tax=Rhodococcus daqingensis TaxID=2479363 RepID=A0ABW2RXW3_9NOCA